jgi:uncharacterized membrane protein YfcA
VEDIMIVAWYVLAGVVAGLFGGMLGIGGGIIVVPLLLVIFSAQNVPDALAVPLSIGTSLATIVFTSVSCARAHCARGSIDWGIVRWMSPALVLGAVAGATTSTVVSPAVPKMAFLLYSVITATHMLVGRRAEERRGMPGFLTLSGVAFVVSSLSGMLGVGGASFFVPLLTTVSMATVTAIGTASALTVPIALAGACSYVVHGLSVAGLPSEALGFVHLQAFAGIALGSMASAPIGVAAAHRLPAAVLRKVFAIVLYVSAGKIGMAALGM